MRRLLSGRVASARGKEGGRADPGSSSRTSSFLVLPVGDTARLPHPLLTAREQSRFWDGQHRALNRREKEKRGLTPGPGQARCREGGEDGFRRWLCGEGHCHCQRS